MKKKNINRLFYIMIVFSIIGLNVCNCTSQSAQADVYNLAKINDGNWWTDISWQKCPALNVFFDTKTTYQGKPTWRVEPGKNAGPDHGAIAVKPGDSVIMKCWVKTSGSTVLPYNGARIGFDYYTSVNWGKRIMGANCPQDASTGIGYPNRGSRVDNEDEYFVHWGTDKWTLLSWSFIVPDLALADGWVQSGVVKGQYTYPGAIVPWCQVLGISPAGTYTCWFSDFQLYINPK